MEQNRAPVGEVIKIALLIAKKYLWLIIAIMILATGAGLTVAYIRKPVYTAKEMAVYKAEGVDTTSTQNSEYTVQYFDTFIEFCKQSCVIDRANFYYDYFTRNTYQSVEDFITDVHSVTSPDDPLYYDAETDIPKTKWLTTSNVGVTASNKDSDTTSYVVTIKYSDKKTDIAKNKVKILVCAIEKEANLLNSAGQKTYFGVDVYVEDYGYSGSSVDWSKVKVVLIAEVVGVLLSIFTVYLVNLLDRTVNDKDDLERLTGYHVLAFLEE